MLLFGFECYRPLSLFRNALREFKPIIISRQSKMKPSRSMPRRKRSLVLLTKKQQPFKKRKLSVPSQQVKHEKERRHSFSKSKASNGAWSASASPSTSNNGNIGENSRAQNFSRSSYPKRSTPVSKNMTDTSQVEITSSSDEACDKYDPGDKSFLFDDDESRGQEEENKEFPSFMADGYNDMSSSHSDNNDDNSSHQMDASEQQTSSGEVENSDGEENETKAKIKYFSDYKSGTIVAILHHPVSFTFYGKARVRVLSGSVDILGYNLDSRKEDFLFLYSFQELSPLQIKTMAVDHKSSSHWQSVMNDLEQCVSKGIANLALNSCVDSSVILLLRKHDLAYPVDSACSYIPCTIPYHDEDSKMLRNKGFTIVPGDDNAIQMSELHESVAERIDQLIRSCVFNNQMAPRILVFGKRGLGKSTTLRYFVNRTLYNHSKVYYLDTDMGQTEFTPPGCVSLVEVTKPLLGPPFTHPKIPVKMAFYGEVSMDNMDAYTSCIDKVVEFYKSNFSDFPLFINTFGWVQGLGKKCLNHIRGVLSPNIEVELSDEIPGKIDYATALQKKKIRQDGVQLYEIPSKVSQDSRQFEAPTKRALSILAYFGRCQPYHAPIMPLNMLKPLCVRIEDVAIHVIHPIFYKCVLQAINASFVALCIVDESQILCCVNDEHKPKRLAPDADFGDCVGFGFVRAVDLTKNILYILTPEPYDVLRKVNTIVKGDIVMPQVVFEKQEIYNQHLPYVKQMYGKKNPYSKKVKRQRKVME